MVVALSGEHMPKEAMSARTRRESSSGAGTVASSIAAIGSVLAASSCCLPFFPFMMAAGLAGTSAFLTEVRPYLLVGSTLFIAFGFYQARHARKCNRRTSTVASVGPLVTSPALWSVVGIGPWGIVAKIREYAIVGPSAQMPASDRQPKQLVDKLQLREWVTFAHPSGSPLPNHVDRLDSL